MIIIKHITKTIKGYIKHYQHVPPLLEEPCPNCKSKLHKHGHFERNIITKSESYRKKIYRWKCSGCSVTISVLPDFVLPYRVHSTLIYEHFWQSIFIQHLSFRQVNPIITSPKTGELPRVTLKRWKRQYIKRRNNLLQRVTKLLLQVDPHIHVTTIVRALNQEENLLRLIKTLWKKIHPSTPHPFYGFLTWINFLL